jgi:hypothetical protein
MLERVLCGPDLMAAFREREILVRWLQTADELAATIRWLLSEKAAAVTARWSTPSAGQTTVRTSRMRR